MPRVELARSVAEFDANTLGGRDALRARLYVDFAFIAAYWLVFATTSALFATKSFSGADWLGAIAGELATLGALADVSENVHALRLLRRGEGAAGDDDAGSVAKAMRFSSLAKWTLLFATTGLLSVMFFERSGWSCVLGGAYALVAGFGLATTAAEALRIPSSGSWGDRLLRIAFLSQCFVLPLGLAIAASQL